MSIEAMSSVLNYSKAQGRAKVVLLGIANHMGDQGAWPSIETLARYANASERSVKRDIQELVEMGELLVEYQAAPVNTQYKTNLYWILVSGVTDSASGVTGQVSRGDRLGKSGVTPVGTQNINITIKEPSIESLKQEFENFWNVYPNKRGKLDAQRAFVKALAHATADEIIAGALRYGNDPNLPEMKFVKHAATWLNKGCWDDPALPVDPKKFRLLEKQRADDEMERYMKGLENE